MSTPSQIAGFIIDLFAALGSLIFGGICIVIAALFNGGVGWFIAAFILGFIFVRSTTRLVREANQ
jgi:hypothetical protein